MSTSNYVVESRKCLGDLRVSSEADASYFIMIVVSNVGLQLFLTCFVVIGVVATRIEGFLVSLRIVIICTCLCCCHKTAPSVLFKLLDLRMFTLVPFFPMPQTEMKHLNESAFIYKLEISRIVV